MVEEEKPRGDGLAKELFGQGLSPTQVAEKLTSLGYLSAPSPGELAVSVTPDLYDGALHPRAVIVYKDPSRLMGFPSEPE